MKKSLGFTLIEVMISMFIMAILAVIVSQTIRSSVSNKQKIETRIKYQAMLYDALRVVKMDVERAFHYQDVFYEIEELAIKQLESEKNKGGQGQEPVTQQRTPPPQLTQFLGEEKSVHFTSLNHFRTKYNAQESNQMEVGYYVDSCKARDGKGSTKCLWRRSSLMIDDKVDEDGNKVVVAEYVTKFNLKYRGDREDEEWVKQWRTDNKGRSDHRNRFPHQVMVELEIHDKETPRANAFDQTLVVNIQFPNNISHLNPRPTAAESSIGTTQ